MRGVRLEAFAVDCVPAAQHLRKRERRGGRHNKPQSRVCGRLRQQLHEHYFKSIIFTTSRSSSSRQSLPLHHRHTCTHVHTHTHTHACIHTNTSTTYAVLLLINQYSCTIVIAVNLSPPPCSSYTFAIGVPSRHWPIHAFTPACLRRVSRLVTPLTLPDTLPIRH